MTTGKVFEQTRADGQLIKRYLSFGSFQVFWPFS